MLEHPPVRENEIGVVTHYWSHLGVAGVHLIAPIDVGDHIHVVGHTSDFEQDVRSIEIDHRATRHADAGIDIGLALADHAREHDKVYRQVSMGDVGAEEVIL